MLDAVTAAIFCLGRRRSKETILSCSGAGCKSVDGQLHAKPSTPSVPGLPPAAQVDGRGPVGLSQQRGSAGPEDGRNFAVPAYEKRRCGRPRSSSGPPAFRIRIVISWQREGELRSDPQDSGMKLTGTDQVRALCLSLPGGYRSPRQGPILTHGAMQALVTCGQCATLQLANSRPRSIPSVRQNVVSEVIETTPLHRSETLQLGADSSPIAHRSHGKCGGVRIRATQMRRKGVEGSIEGGGAPGDEVAP